MSHRSPRSLSCSQLPTYFLVRHCWALVWAITHGLWCWLQTPSIGSPRNPSTTLHPLCTQASYHEHTRKSKTRLGLLLAPKLGSLSVSTLVVPRLLLAHSSSSHGLARTNASYTTKTHNWSYLATHSFVHVPMNLCLEIKGLFVLKVLVGSRGYSTLAIWYHVKSFVLLLGWGGEA